MDRAEQDQRVRRQGDPRHVDVVLGAVRARIGWPELRVSQDETLEVEPEADGRVRFRYTFDHDFASQYDQTASWEGCLDVGTGELIEWRRG